MYNPEHFIELDDAEITRIIKEFPLACLVATGKNGLIANHIPFIHQENILWGHIARNNPLPQEIADNREIMVIYRSDDAYISPNYYPSKQIHHKVVPTWNYQAVHFYGQIEFFDDEKSLRRIVGQLTKTHESQTQEKPWRMADAPEDYMQDMLAKIVAIKISITKTIAKSKLSQNRDKADAQSAMHQINARGKTKIATAMQRKLGEN